MRPSPEAHYVLGCLYYELNRDTLAMRHLRKATKMDAGYTEAFYLLAQVYERMGRTELAQQALGKASLRSPSSSRDDGTLASPAIRTRKAAPLFHVNKSGTPRLMARIDKRIADAVREDALRAYKINNQQSH